MNGHDEQDTVVEEVEVGTIDQSVALMAVDKAAIDIQIATAKAYPRLVTDCINDALELATMDQETAGGCFYSLPRSGKDIEGPSVRLAEIMAHSWGNLRVDADIVAIDDKWVTAMGTCFDLEKNVAVRVRVKRRITDKRGQRYNEDMIGVTSNAAISIAVRNAVFKVIPNVFTKRIYQKARQASLGKGTMEEKRKNALAAFAGIKVKPEQLYALLGIKGEDDLGVEELIKLRGLLTAIQDGDTTVELTFNPPKETSEGAAELNKALGDDGGGDLSSLLDDDPDKAATPKQKDALFARWNDLVEEAGIDWVENSKWSDSTFKKWLRSNDAPITGLTQAGVVAVSKMLEDEPKQVIKYIEKERP